MLPIKVREMLKSGNLCCFGTINGVEPYMSLMVYTFCEDEEYLIMSSRKDSVKVRNILINPQAAILVHENENLENPISMTLNGRVVIAEGKRADELRSLHLQAHPESSQFIVGEQMAMLTFIPVRAVLSDRQDSVTYWQK